MDASSYVASYSLIIHPAFRKCRASSCGPGNFKNEERPPFFTVSSLELHHVGQGNRVNDAPWRTPVSRRELVRIYATWILKRDQHHYSLEKPLTDFSSSSSRFVIFRPWFFFVKKNRENRVLIVDGRIKNGMNDCGMRLGLMRCGLVLKLILISCLRFIKIIYVKLIFILEKNHINGKLTNSKNFLLNCLNYWF